MEGGHWTAIKGNVKGVGGRRKKVGMKGGKRRRRMLGE